MRAIACFGIPAVLALSLCSPVAAQHHHAAFSVPFIQANSGFSEQIGVSFGVHAPHFFFQENGFGGAAPQFGPAGGGLSTGGAFSLPGGGYADFHLLAQQGSQTSLGGSSVSSTIQDGGWGGLAGVSSTPFVTGVVPVVGQDARAPAFRGPLDERLWRLREGGAASYGVRPGSAADRAAGRAASKGGEPAAKTDALRPGPAAEPAISMEAASSTAAGRGTGAPLASVAELRERRATAAAAEMRVAEGLAERAQAAETAGKLGVARIYYQQAAQRAGEGARQREWAARAAALATAPRSRGSR